jgi:hypothetical protein
MRLIGVCIGCKPHFLDIKLAFIPPGQWARIPQVSFGRYTLLDRRDDAGQEMALGVYFYRLAAGVEMLSGKMVLLK